MGLILGSGWRRAVGRRGLANARWLNGPTATTNQNLGSPTWGADGGPMDVIIGSGWRRAVGHRSLAITRWLNGPTATTNQIG